MLRGGRLITIVVGLSLGLSGCWLVAAGAGAEGGVSDEGATYLNLDDLPLNSVQ